MKSSHIAPCGMNCALCYAFQREKNKCYGCNSDNITMNYCKVCKIKNCDELNKYCFKCDNFPCQRLKQLDKRYKTKYNMSMIENLKYVKENGIRDFINKEKDKWKCEKCNNYICVHKNYCINCNKKVSTK